MGGPMRFNSKANLDSSRTRDVGGGGRTGGGSIGLPHVAGGGGVVGVIIAIIYVIIQMQGGGSGGGGLGQAINGSAFTTNSVGLSGSSGSTFDYGTCETGEDANRSDECALVAVENSLTDYWSKQPQVSGHFQPEQAIDVFHGSVQTNGCGNATTDVGPFYCSDDQTIYLDTAFYDTIFKQLGGDATPFVRAYVIAHEYGHHIQDLLGTMGKVRTQQGPDSDSVRLELQADCYAGMWAAAATTVPDSDGNVLIEDLTQQDINHAIGAAKEVGDDYIQQRMGGRVNPEQWTHGSSAEREHWFQTGMNAHDDIKACDTFSARKLG
ncbi:KPN_02809 family neutral zinc metallopeptidase [Nocardioides nematodiphilus]|uniref:KPN_02809 family neutral zinc metallopeptidase n=1 Tax=Nocardioides nematodiphilus TaxID=2849669 RepID=UPI001CDA2F9F|nr:neutral zinc metallopeptidase [Nocardioides nematodiphilus]MCA1981927.1 neutral zinc metallopeptidase [Nocardioides nematodiphilus]